MNIDLIYHPEVTQLWRDGKKIEAIKLLRERAGVSLVVSKTQMESYDRGFKDALRFNGLSR